MRSPCKLSTMPAATRQAKHHPDLFGTAVCQMALIIPRPQIKPLLGHAPLVTSGLNLSLVCGDNHLGSNQYEQTAELISPASTRQLWALTLYCQIPSESTCRPAHDKVWDGCHHQSQPFGIDFP